MEEEVVQICQRLKEANDRQKNYADAKRIPQEELKGRKGSIKGKTTKEHYQVRKDCQAPQDTWDPLRC